MTEEAVDPVAGGTTATGAPACRPSEAAKMRVEELIRREKSDGLTAEETAELDHFMQLEHLTRLAKALERRNVSHE